MSETLLLEEQSVLRTGRSCINSVFVIKQTIEKRREFNSETHMAFLDIEKAFDRVDRNMLRQVLNGSGFPHHLIKTTENLYNNTSIQINTGKEILEKSIINQGLGQGCDLSPALFNIYIDDLFRKWKLQVDPGIILKANVAFNNLLLAGDQLIIQDSEEKLQQSIY
jgi:hypothetical protein